MEIIEKLEGIESPLEVGLKINEVIDGLKNTSSLPIGTIIPVNANSSYIPEGTLPCDGAEYSKAQFEQLWENYIKTSFLNTCTYEEYEQDLATYGQCGKFGVKPLEYDGSGLTIVGTPTITNEGLASGFGTSDNITANLNILEANELKITTKFNYVNSTGTQVLYWLNNCGLRLTQESNGAIAVYSQSGSIFYQAKSSFGSPAEGDEIFTELVVTPTNAELKLIINEKTYSFKKADLSLTLTSTLVGIGSSYYNGNTPFSSVIDLKEFSITANGQTVLSCGIGNKFKVPTIKDGAVLQQAMTDGELGKSYNEGLPNITGCYAGEMDKEGKSRINGAFYIKSVSNAGCSNEGEDGYIGYMDASLSDATYGKTDDISLQKVQMNAVAVRYFVVVANGQLSESAMNWSEWASSLQAKANADLSNCTKPYIVEVSDKSLFPSWYRVYSDGWCEQGGQVAAKVTSVTLLKGYETTDYIVNTSTINYGGGDAAIGTASRTTTSFTLTSSTYVRSWEAKGYIN